MACSCLTCAVESGESGRPELVAVQAYVIASRRDPQEALERAMSVLAPEDRRASAASSSWVSVSRPPAQSLLKVIIKVL